MAGVQVYEPSQAPEPRAPLPLLDTRTRDVLLGDCWDRTRART